MSRNSSSILVFGFAILFFSILGLFFAFSLNNEPKSNFESYLSGQCTVGSSYYQLSDLKRSEKLALSQRAIGLSVIGASSREYRIILDYSYLSGIRDSVKVKYSVISEPESLEGLSLSFLIDGLEKDLTPPKNTSGGKIISGSGEINVENYLDTIGILLKRNGDCEFKVNDLITLDATVKNNPNGYSETSWILPDDYLTLKPGFNYYGSLDWIEFQSIIDQGFNVLGYDGATKKWIGDKKFGEAEKAYVIYNPTKNTIKVSKPADFRVPDDLNSPTVSKGWNLLYLTENRSFNDLRMSFNQNNKEFVSKELVSAKELVDRRIMNEDVFILKSEKFSKTKLSSITDYSGPVWVYLADELRPSLKQINIPVEIIGGGDTYKNLDQVLFRVNIINNDSETRYLADQSVNDCQLKLIISDEKGRQLFDSTGSNNCLTWAKLDKLSPGEKKEYNYTWKVPKNVTGNLLVKAVLNYSRMGKTVQSETQITIK